MKLRIPNCNYIRPLLSMIKSNRSRASEASIRKMNDSGPFDSITVSLVDHTIKGPVALSPSTCYYRRWPTRNILSSIFNDSEVDTDIII